LQRLALDNLIRLAETTGDTAFLVVRRGLHTLCLHREEGNFPIRTHVLKVGDRHPLGAGAAGLAILAAIADGEAERIIETNAPLYQQRYPGLTPSALRDRLALARHKGWALNPGLIFAGSWGLAVAIRNSVGDPIAALTIACIESRLQAERQEIIGPLLQAEAEKLEMAMAQSASAPAKELTARARGHALRGTASVGREDG
jgi:DNA-binding IclR family transcriptional regulator